MAQSASGGQVSLLVPRFKSSIRPGRTRGCDPQMKFDLMASRA